MVFLKTILTTTNTYSQLSKALPNIGLGLGLRSKHFDYILNHKPPVDWFEVISENFMDTGGRPRHILNQIAEHYPIVMHGVSLSIGSTDPVNYEYLEKLKQLAADVKPAWVSDHLCWTGVLGMNTHDLLPVPLTRETLAHIAERIMRVQDYLHRPLVLENPSTYLAFQHSTIPEPEFLARLTEETGCSLLLDVNNVYVTCFNNDLDPVEYINHIPADKVVQMHIAGHQFCGTHIIDTHDREVIPEVWELFHQAWQHTEGTSVLLEWDSNIPEFEQYHTELLKAKKYMESLPTDFISGMPTIEAQTVSNPLSFIVPEITTNE